MKKVYICSPCRGDYDNNIENAITYCRQVFKLGYMPVAPHIYFTRFLNDDIPEEREAAMKAGSRLLLECSEVWVFGLDNPSEGMKAEIALAIRSGIPVKDGELETARRLNKVEMKAGLTSDDLKALRDQLDRAMATMRPGEAREVVVTVRRGGRRCKG